MIATSSALKVRRQILMLAVIGAASFAIYLSVVGFLAFRNEQRLNTIIQIKQPLIEHLRSAEQTIGSFKTDLTNAISLEDGYLLEDGESKGREFAAHLQAALALDTAHHDELAHLLDDTTHYRDEALQLARVLVSDPGKAYEHVDDVAHFNSTHEALLTRLSGLINQRLADYSADLHAAESALGEARVWGVVLGALTIIGLLGLTIPVMRNATRAIERSDRLKDEFLSTISHELRTPMNGIMGAIALLRETHLSAPQHQLVEAATSSSSDMLMAVNDMLEFSDFITGNVSLHSREFELSSLVSELVPKWRQECQRKSLTLEVALPSDGWLWRGDADHIAHVLRHLLSNAVKFTREGTIRLAIDTVGCDNDPTAMQQRRLVCTVRDSGPGVPDHLLENVFKPFQQADGSYTREHGGLGIGLPICQRIATALGGELTVRNHPEGGAIVTFDIPLEGRAVPRPAEPEATPVAPPAATSFPEALNVLVVEDNKVNQMVINGYLKRLGCKATTANHGEEALDKLMRDSFDVILMDCQMPVMDGFEATRAIRKLGDEVRARLPIIAVTANVMEGDRERCFDSGMDDYLPKPVDMQALKAAIERNLKPVKAA